MVDIYFCWIWFSRWIAMLHGMKVAWCWCVHDATFTWCRGKGAFCLLYVLLWRQSMVHTKSFILKFPFKRNKYLLESKFRELCSCETFPVSPGVYPEFVRNPRIFPESARNPRIFPGLPDSYLKFDISTFLMHRFTFFV